MIRSNLFSIIYRFLFDAYLDFCILQLLIVIYDLLYSAGVDGDIYVCGDILYTGDDL